MVRILSVFVGFTLKGDSKRLKPVVDIDSPASFHIELKKPGCVRVLYSDCVPLWQLVPISLIRVIIGRPIGCGVFREIMQEVATRPNESGEDSSLDAWI